MADPESDARRQREVERRERLHALRKLHNRHSEELLSLFVRDTGPVPVGSSEPDVLSEREVCNAVMDLLRPYLARCAADGSLGRLRVVSTAAERLATSLMTSENTDAFDRLLET